jgi:RNA polymerase sigma-70 factor (ECF subfamily)
MTAHDEFMDEVMPNYDRLVRALTLTCGNRENAEDAVQEAVVRAWLRAHRGDAPRSLEGWIAVVAMNEVRTGGRRHARHGRAVQRLQSRAEVHGHDPSAADAVADTMAVHAALQALAPRQREVTVLHYYLGFDIAEAATLLGISAGAARNALHNAKAHLADAFRLDGAADGAAHDTTLATTEEAGHG